MIVLYCLDSPSTFDLINKLDEMGVLYEIHDDVDELIDKGFRVLPVLEVDGKALDYKRH